MMPCIFFFAASVLTIILSILFMPFLDGPVFLVTFVAIVMAYLVFAFCGDRVE